jgi:outer membrane murein-binding lipoprotein Lpp
MARLVFLLLLSLILTGCGMNSGKISQLRDKVASLQSELQHRSATISALSAQLKAAKAGAIEKEADLRAALDAYTFAEWTDLRWAGFWSHQTLALGQSLASLPSGVKKVPVSAHTPDGYAIAPVPLASLWVWPLVVLVWSIYVLLAALLVWGAMLGFGFVLAYLRNISAKWQIREHEDEAKQLRKAQNELASLAEKTSYQRGVVDNLYAEIKTLKGLQEQRKTELSKLDAEKRAVSARIAKVEDEARAEAKAQHIAELRAEQKAKEQAGQAKRQEAEEKLGDVLKNFTLD